MGTLINGTAYDVSSGRVRIDGTGYAISKGRTLINGTGYTISLSKQTISFTITRNGTSYAYEAEDGMTWSEFIDSGYNDGDVYEDGGGYVSLRGLTVYYNYTPVFASETIIADREYQAMG